LKSIQKAIYTKFTGSTLQATYGDILFHASVPPGVRFPFIVFSKVTASPEKTFTETFKNRLVQFSIFSAYATPDEADDIIDAVESLYDECLLSISGISFLRMHITNTVEPYQDDSISQDGVDGGWACHLDFDLLTDET
jgi:hypothetical protein